MCGNGREGGEVAYSGIGSRISLTLVEFQLHLSLKSDCRRDPQSLCSPSPILMKLAQVVRLGLKRSLATPGRIGRKGVAKLCFRPRRTTGASFIKIGLGLPTVLRGSLLQSLLRGTLVGLHLSFDPVTLTVE